MAENIKYRFIENVGDYFPSDYFGEDFLKKVQQLADYTDEQMKALCPPYVQLKEEYNSYKNFIINSNPLPKHAIARTNEFHQKLLSIMGYNPQGAGYQEKYVVSEEGEKIEIVPVRNILRHHDKIQMLIMEMRPLIKVGETEPEGLFQQQYDDGEITPHQRYSASHWESVFTFDKEREKISPSVINKAVSQIFLMPEDKRPQYILMLAGSKVMLFDKEKWARGSYLVFSLDELFSQASISTFRNYYALFHLLVCKETLASDSEAMLMSDLLEDSYKNAHSVTQELKEGVVKAVETIANEALYYMKNVAHLPFGKLQEDGTYDETDDRFEAEVKDDCLTLVYRLLFIFYAESRQELEILPTNDEVYNKGYSLEMLRDLEQVNLISQDKRDGYFFDDSIKTLFRLLSAGVNEGQVDTKAFRVIHIDSPMFDDDKFNHLKGVKLRNQKWQEIIRSLSLSNKNGQCGRISYANLGVNQLGSVYESLLAYRGFYAEEDYIEVHKADTPEDGTFLVPYSRMEAFESNEILSDENGMPIILKKGTFVYRLNGRDRQKSASYYTPEVLTRSTVKYTLKGILEKVENGEMSALELLNLKILEPAMGAAAFQNEVINQLAEAYLTYRSKEKRSDTNERWRIEPDKYRDELQKVKAYIATHNVYGVDLNPTAIELGKLSLWLNVIHKDMETPFFSNRLALGNAVIGAWLKVYDRKEVVGKPKHNKSDGLIPTEWWNTAPHRLHFNGKRVLRKTDEIYHFLLPDKNMLGVRSIKEQKAAHQTEFVSMSQKLADWTKALTSDEFVRLQKISQKIDILLKEYVEFQMSIEALTKNRYEIWGTPNKSEQSLLDLDDFVDTYKEKQLLNDTRYRHDNAYYRLKMVMDYWCSLWFWEYEDAANLPTREDYWADIEAMLNVPDSMLNGGKNVIAKVEKDGQARMFEQGIQTDIFDDQKVIDINPYSQTTQEESELLTKSKQEILEETQGENLLIKDSYRFKIVARLAERYHFFHPMLEFLEVFWLRDGFDIICGNPPWINVAFDEQGIIAEKYPEVAIRKMTAPQVRCLRDNMFLQIPLTEKIYRGEEIDTTCTGVFVNAYANYPLLSGLRTNLYKSILVNGFDELSGNGYMGLLHPETIYDDPSGQSLRQEVYHRLRYHFQYINEKKLFAEVDHHTKYGTQIYGGRRDNIDFYSIHNLFHPSTIDGCFAHDGHGVCGGIKDSNGDWNISAHKDRIVRFTAEELQTLSDAFEEGTDWRSVKLTSVHAAGILRVLKVFSEFPKHVSDIQNVIVSEGLNETTSVDRGWMKREVKFPNMKLMELIYSGPHFYVGNPLYKTPKSVCLLNSDYDIVDASSISENFISRTNYTPTIPLPQFRKIVQGFQCGLDLEGKPQYDDWTQYYKVGFRRMVGPTSERTLSGAILLPNCNHIGGVVSTTFKEEHYLLEFAGLTHSLPLDFFIKTLGIMDIHASRVYPLPLGIKDKYKSALFVRTLQLNCLTEPYRKLWEGCWKEEYKRQQWSINDKRLKPFNTLTEEWSWDIPLRNYFERRQALVEIDVIAAMALGLSLEDLEMIYTIQFPVLQQNENDTWYDQEGKIVFTCSKGLTGVGLDRPDWDQIKGKISDDGLTAFGTTPTYEHTITKSELYQEQKQTFIAPYTKCDRIADYRRAWAHFEKIFGK